MPAEPDTRPPIDAVKSGAELRRWYWLKTELVALARRRGVSPGGGKIELTERLATHLDGAALPVSTGHPGERADAARGGRGPAAGGAGAQLTGPLTPATVIPAGQRSSQALRAFFTDAIGPGFRFDGPMREFIARGAGRTLGDAVDHWHATRNQPRGEIAPQFELNRFVRAWHEANPGGTHAEALAAWREHRALPADQRS